MPCPFCELHGRVVAENDLAVAIEDLEPVSAGHMLIIPKRHVEDIFELDAAEVESCHTLLRAARDRLSTERKPDGFNVGANQGSAAGQTIQHAHLHLIPRYLGDHPDPRGGIRHVIPNRR